MRKQQRPQIREGRLGRSDADKAVCGDEDLLPAGSRRLAAHACVAFDAASPAGRAGVFIQCFGGSCGIAKAIAHHPDGRATEGHDIIFSKLNDFADPAVVRRLIERIQLGQVVGLGIDMPCQSFTRARRNDGRGPGPLRSDERAARAAPS